MARRQGRITKEDIHEAGFRRWDGRDRITTDWNNVFQVRAPAQPFAMRSPSYRDETVELYDSDGHIETSASANNSQDPELCWPNGDCLVYLREPGQSSRGPAFRIHIARLRKQGFGFLLAKCVTGQTLHTSTQCNLSNRCVCSSNLPTIELYLPAPHSGLDATLDHHVTTRNFFAWLYNVPQAGRALGPALTALLERVNFYRPAEPERNRTEVFAYVESQKYLDFRECVDHALATLCFAEHLQEEDLWVDAFAHCVGLSHRGLHESVEYEVRAPFMTQHDRC